MSLAAEGLCMPAEWQPHSATWLSYPLEHPVWQGQLEAARDDMAQLIAVIADFEPVVLNVSSDALEADAERRLRARGAAMANIRLQRLPLDDAWFRDNGPIFVHNRLGEVVLTDWRFNAWGETFPHWQHDDAAPAALAELLNLPRYAVPMVLEGGAIDVNGQGLAVTTASCLRNPNRNPDFSPADICGYLRDYLGVHNLLWLEAGLVDDHTDGHIDMVARFANEHTLLCSVALDDNNPNAAVLANNLRSLERSLYDLGIAQHYKLIPLPLPQKQRHLAGLLLPQSYANFYIGNGFVTLPVYDDPHDAEAVAILREHFPGRDVIPVASRGLIVGGGSLHCVTQQQPAPLSPQGVRHA